MVLRWKQTGLALFLSAALAVVGGCQAVGGVDLGKALEQQASVASLEANEDFSIELISGNGAFDSKEDEALARRFNKVQLKNIHTLMQDETHASFEGVIVSSSISIPFQINLDGENLIIQLAGGKKPIVINDARQPAFRSPSVMFKEQLQKHTEEAKQLRNVLNRFIFRNAPNPAHVDVSQVTESVYGGGTLSMNKIQLELKGSELKGLLQSFLKAIAADDAGLKELIGQLYDIAVPMLKESMKAEQKMRIEEYGLEDSAFDEINNLEMAYLDNKTLAVEFVYTTLKQYLDKAIKELDKADLAKAPAGVQRLLTDGLSFKADWFLDSRLNLRKQHLDLTLPIGDTETDPIAAVRFVGDRELWKHNEPVAVKPAPDTKDAIKYGGLRSSDNRALLANFDPKSDMYRILKDDLHINRQRIVLLFSGNEVYKYDATHPYIDASGTAMVSARFFAERLGAKVTWDEATQSVRITDAQSGVVIETTVGSADATLNGNPVQLASQVTKRNGTTFVPLRFIAEALGAKLEWKVDNKILTVTRD